MVKSNPIVEEIQNQMRTVDSKINLLAGKLKTLEKNQEITGRTLLSLRDVVKKGGSENPNTNITQGTADSAELDTLKKELDGVRQNVAELKYVLDSINPLNYATIDQVKELLNERLKK
jgi:prefoldin subunit 5